MILSFCALTLKSMVFELKTASDLQRIATLLPTSTHNKKRHTQKAPLKSTSKPYKLANMTLMESEDASAPLITDVERVEVVAPASLPEGYGLEVSTTGPNGETRNGSVLVVRHRPQK